VCDARIEVVCAVSKSRGGRRQLTSRCGTEFVAAAIERLAQRDHSFTQWILPVTSRVLASGTACSQAAAGGARSTARSRSWRRSNCRNRRSSVCRSGHRPLRGDIGPSRPSSVSDRPLRRSLPRSAAAPRRLWSDRPQTECRSRTGRLRTSAGSSEATARPRQREAIDGGVGHAPQQRRPTRVQAHTRQRMNKQADRSPECEITRRNNERKVRFLHARHAGYILVQTKTT
jgi:hypothetical protein